MYIYIYIYIYVYVHVFVLTTNGGSDVSGLPSFGSNRHRNTIIFDTRKTLENIFGGLW